MKKLNSLLCGILIVLVLFGCNEKTHQIKKISQSDLESIQYLYPDFEPKHYIDYSYLSAEEDVLSENVSWSDVVDAYKHQLDNALYFEKVAEQVQNDYYKGRITGEEIQKQGMTLLAISGLLSKSVILPIDASPELKSLAKGMNSTLFYIKTAMFADYEFIFDDESRIVEINKKYNTLDYDKRLDNYKEGIQSLESIVKERESEKETNTK